MKKINTNKVCIFWMFFCFSFSVNILLATIPSLIIDFLYKPTYMFLYYVSFTILFTLISYIFFPLIYKKNKRVIFINEYTFEYKDYKKPFNDFTIDKHFIERCYYRKVPGNFYRFILILKDDRRFEITLSKRIIKKVKKILVQGIDESKLDKVPKKRLKNWLRKLKSFIIEERISIIYVLSGTLLTIFSFIISKRYNNIGLSICLSVICVIQGGFQLDNIWLKEKHTSLLDRFLLACLFIIVFTVIQFGLVCLIELVLLKRAMSIYYLFYSFYLVPSFVLVITLSYA